VGRVAERDAVRSQTGGRAPAASPLTGPARAHGRLPRGVGSATPQRGGPLGPPGDTGAPLPLSAARTRPGGPLEAASRPDGTTTMGRERALGSGLGERRPMRRSEMRDAFCIVWRISS
jgi:hypothetical protein